MLTFIFRQLRVIIENFRELHRGGDFWENFHPDTCTWYHVHDELSKVEDEYKRKGSILRRALRGDGLTRNLTPMLEGIPENDGLGFLKGGLIILFNVCSTFCHIPCIAIYKCCSRRLSSGGHKPVLRSLLVLDKSPIFSEGLTRL